jgi:cytochrome P450
MAVMVVVLVLLFLSLVLLWQWHKRDQVEWARGMPALSRWHTFRLYISKQQHLELLELQSRLGRIYFLPRVPFLSPSYVVVVTDPAAAKVALRSECKGPFYDNFRSEGEEDIFSGDGQLWKKGRRIANPAFSSSAIRALHHIMVEEVQVMFGRIDAAISRQSTTSASGGGEGLAVGSIPTSPRTADALDADDLCSKLALDITGRAIFGRTFHAQTDAKAPVLVALQENLKEIQARESNPFRFLNWKANKKFHENAELVRRVAQQAIEDRRRTENWDQTKDLLSILMKSNEKENDQIDSGKFPDTINSKNDSAGDYQIAIELEVFLSAGHETTAHSMAWTLYHLARNSAILKQLQEEVDAVLGKRKFPSQEDITRLPFLDCVIKESMRLSPVAPIGSLRQQLEDIDICGFRIPKGVTVWVPFYPMFLNPELWDDPTEFRPSRFNGFMNDSKYIPFSSGPRNCIGQTMAMQEMRIAISSIVKNYTFSLHPRCKVEAVLETTLKPRGLLMLFQPRNVVFG